MGHQRAKPESGIARIAAGQHNVVSFKQLRMAGLTASMVKRRTEAGRLHRVHRGVYAVGTPSLTREGHWMAAVLACGDGAVLSHESAAVLWGISPTCPANPHVTVPSQNGRAKRRGIVVHRSMTLTRGEVTTRQRIPVTTHARTLRDLGYGPEPTRSDMERLFLRICRKHGISKPEVNARVGPYEVNFLWRPERLIVEADSWSYHSSRASFEADRARDVELKRRDFEVLRFTYRQLTSDPGAVIAALRMHLDRGSRRVIGHMGQ
jgi:very-short-patch-repair endonuclease